MEVGVCKIAEDSDYQAIKNMCLGLDSKFSPSPSKESDDGNGKSTAGWRLDHDSPDLSVWIKFDKKVSDIYSIRVRSNFDNVPLATLYDVLLDPEYRKTWDTMMIESFELCNITPNTDIGYYSVRCPPPITNRDFVLLRTFLDLKKEIYVFSYSINHKVHFYTISLTFGFILLFV